MRQPVTIFAIMIEKYDNLDKLETALNQGWQNRLPNHLKSNPQKVAIDVNLIPYCGEPSRA